MFNSVCGSGATGRVNVYRWAVTIGGSVGYVDSCLTFAVQVFSEIHGLHIDLGDSCARAQTPTPPAGPINYCICTFTFRCGPLRALYGRWGRRGRRTRTALARFHILHISVIFATMILPVYLMRSSLAPFIVQDCPVKMRSFFHKVLAGKLVPFVIAYVVHL